MASTTLRAITARYVKLLASATPAQIEAGAQWYDDAREYARLIADNLNRQTTLFASYGEEATIETGACILAAYSPNNRWANNISCALRYSLGETVGGLYAKPAKLADIRARGLAAITGPKLRAFARNIIGDPDAVTIDVWMARAAKLSGEVPTAKEYRTCEAAIHAAARKYNLTPATAQAVVWVIQRGAAD